MLSFSTTTHGRWQHSVIKAQLHIAVTYRSCLQSATHTHIGHKCTRIMQTRDMAGMPLSLNATVAMPQPLACNPPTITPVHSDYNAQTHDTNHIWHKSQAQLVHDYITYLARVIPNTHLVLDVTYSHKPGVIVLCYCTLGWLHDRLCKPWKWAESNY